ncbi:MAG: hypothetical protein AAGD13_12040 [Pseudomonadota bacterium]
MLDLAHVRILVATLLLAGCAAIEPAATTFPAEKRLQAYNAAVVAAAVPPQGGTKTPLLQVEEGEVQVVSWNDPKFYPIGDQTLDRNVWVTIVPQVQNMCRALPNGGTTARMEELLGLAPGDGTGRQMIVMTTETRHLFRPCADPSLDQTTCPLSVPNARPIDYPEDHWNADLAFVLNQASTSYVQTGGYPFTRLGYTYDWNAASPDNVGPSEFLVRNGTKVAVTAQVPTGDYCAAPSG